MLCYNNTPLPDENFTCRLSGRTPAMVAAALFSNQTQRIRLEPGDATRYELVLVPLTTRVQQASLLVVNLTRMVVCEVPWLGTHPACTDDFLAQDNEWTRVLLAHYCSLLHAAVLAAE